MCADRRALGFSLGGASVLRDQDLAEGSALEAFLLDDIELQVLFQLGERAVARAEAIGTVVS